MLWTFEGVVDAALLDDLPRVHGQYPVARLGYHSEVVGDEQCRGASFFAELHDQVEHLSLNRHIESSRWLVGDQQLGLAYECHGDHRPLAHAARQLVGVFPKPALRFRNADLLQKIDRALFGDRTALTVVGSEGGRNLLTNSENRVECCHGLLEDHGDLLAPLLAKLLVGQGKEVNSVEQHFPADHGRWRCEPQQRQSREGLAASTLADHLDALTGVDGEVRSAHGMGYPARCSERDGEITNLKQIGAGHYFTCPAAEKSVVPLFDLRRLSDLANDRRNRRSVPATGSRQSELADSAVEVRNLAGERGLLPCRHHHSAAALIPSLTSGQASVGAQL